MAEISYIEQNGQQVNLKDAKGRELLATKQNKLTAGKGISISEDGTISATGATFFKELVVKDCVESGWSGYDYVFDLHLQYAGNPALVKQQIMNHDCSSYTQSFMDNEYIPSFSILYNPHKQEVYNTLSSLPDTGESYLIVVALYGEVTEATANDSGIDYTKYNVGDKYFFSEKYNGSSHSNNNSLSEASFALVNTAQYSGSEREVYLYSESSNSDYYWNTVEASSVIKIIAMISAGINIDDFCWKG